MSVITDPPLADGHPAREGPGLPVPPSDAEKDMYADRNLALIIRTSLASFGALLISQARFVLLSPPLLALAPFIAFTLVYYVISLCVNIGTRGFDLDGAPAARAKLAAATAIRAWTSSCPFAGSRSMSWPTPGRTLAGSSALTRARWAPTCWTTATTPTRSGWPGRSDSPISCVPDRGWMKKAGNLRYAFGQTSGEFILILDADFAPRADLPAELLPYLFADPSLGIVQSPQFFHTDGPMSWMQRGAGAVQELFYRLVQVSRDRHEGAICVGSCAIYRRTALAVNGGTYPDRPFRGRPHRL